MAEDLSSLIKAVKKDLKGAATITSVTDIVAPFETRLATGILSLDIALKGGFPAGSMHQLFGPDGAGKDFLSNLVIAQLQKKHGDDTNIAWMSFGYKPDVAFMEMCGIDTDLGNFLVIDVGEGSEDHPAESLLSTVIKFVESNKFHLIVVNELGSGETRDNVVKLLHEDAKIATWASLMSSFCQKFYSALRRPGPDGESNSTCVIMINPVRANIDARAAKYNPYNQGGGYALKHAKAVDLHLRPGGFIRAKQEKVGKEIKWKISKGKHGISEGADGSYDFIFNRGVDLVADLAHVAKAYGVIRCSGPVYYILDYEDKIKGGMDAVVEMLRASPALAEEVREKTLEAANG